MKCRTFNVHLRLLFFYCFIDTNLLKTFLRGCRMDFERARKKLETFCYSRSRYRDLFEHRSLNEPPLNDVCKFL